ncbi:MAG: hypothetical protein MJE68_24705 [Proteobacteria bacterium]|nr:hypothetical protein [Pseudomonadota bacterium]
MFSHFNASRVNWVVIFIFLLGTSCTAGDRSPSSGCVAGDESECKNNPVNIYNPIINIYVNSPKSDKDEKIDNESIPSQPPVLNLEEILQQIRTQIENEGEAENATNPKN